MQKQEIIDIIQNLRSSYVVWLEQGKIIVDGINLDRLEQPSDYGDCDYCTWYEANKNKISVFSWSEELHKMHKGLHQTYSNLFFDSMRKYKPRTMGELQKHFNSLEAKSTIFKNKLDEINAELITISDDDFNDLLANRNSDSTASIDSDSDEKTRIMKSTDFVEKSTNAKDSPSTEEFQIVDGFNDQTVDANNKTVEGSYNKTVEDSHNKTVEDSNNKTVEGSHNKTVDDSYNITAEDSKNKGKHIEASAQIEKKVSDVVVDAYDNNIADDEQSENKNTVMEKAPEVVKLVNTKAMQSININEYNDKQNLTDELDTLEVNSSAEDKDSTKASEDKMDKDSAVSKIENKVLEQTFKPTVNIAKHISLKEQNIVRLKQEKELAILELAHLEETQKLTQQGFDQLAQYQSLKQEEIELEQADNDGIIQFRTEAKKLIKDELEAIDTKKLTLISSIDDLENQVIEGQLEQENEKKQTSIEKQFQELKLNKNKDLDQLQEHKKVRENDLSQLKKQLELLEEEISDMDIDIENKKQGMMNLEEKEKSKNEERSQQQLAKEKVTKEHKATISEMNKELDLLIDQEKVKQTEFEALNVEHTELLESNERLLGSNTDELKELEQQQEQKHEQLKKTEELKSSKQLVIKDIEIRLVSIERSLAKLKLEQEDNNNEQSEDQLEIAE